jgi:hypothetical protein
MSKQNIVSEQMFENYENIVLLLVTLNLDTLLLLPFCYVLVDCLIMLLFLFISSCFYSCLFHHTFIHLFVQANLFFFISYSCLFHHHFDSLISNWYPLEKELEVPSFFKFNLFQKKFKLKFYLCLKFCLFIYVLYSNHFKLFFCCV